VCELEVFDAGVLLDDLAGLVEAIDGMRNAGAALHEGRQPRDGAIVVTRKPPPRRRIGRVGDDQRCGRPVLISPESRRRSGSGRGRQLRWPTFSYRAFDFRAAALTDVSHLNQAIGEPYCLALLRAHRFVFFRGHPAPTAWTDHNWLFWTPTHCREITQYPRTPSGTRLSWLPSSSLHALPAARASGEIVAKHGDDDQRIANDPAHRPAVKFPSILTLRPPELSGRDAEHLTEVTRQMALVGKPHGIRNLRQ
jgi:hypothetical protein